MGCDEIHNEEKVRRLGGTELEIPSLKISIRLGGHGYIISEINSYVLKIPSRRSYYYFMVPESR
jgi:hypothetical protein